MSLRILRSLLSRVALLGALGATAAPASPATAATCHVPSHRPTIQDALDDPICTTVQVAIGVYDEILSVERSVILTGTGVPKIQGNIGVRGSAVLTVTGFQVETYNDTVDRALCSGLVAIENGQIDPDQITVTALASFPTCLNARGDLLFADGVETATTNRWSATVP